MSRSSPSLPLAVVGGGIGGLAAALAAARAGREVVLVERSAAFGELGAGLQLAPNACAALEDLGVLDAVRQAAVDPPRLVMMDATSGAEITGLDLGSERYRARFAHPYLVTHRTDLHGALLDACADHPRVTLRTGRTVTGIDQDDERVLLRFAETDELVEADAAIAADGLRSRIREQVVGDGPPLCSRYVAYRGALPAERMSGRMSDHAASGAVMVWAGPRMHLVQYPVRRGELYNQVAVFESDQYTPHDDDWGTEAELEERFSSACGAVRDALPLISRERRWPLYDREPLGTWVYGRIALLGDAAHPMLQYLAQGACQALEDAVCLGQALETGDSTTEAFAAYARLRSPRAALIQANARRFGEICHLQGMGAALRNTLLHARAHDDFTDIAWVWTPSHQPAAAGSPTT